MRRVHKNEKRSDATIQALQSEKDNIMHLVCYRIHLIPYQDLLSTCFKDINIKEEKHKLFERSLINNINIFHETPQISKRKKQCSASLVWESEDKTQIFFRFGKERNTEIRDREFRLSNKVINWDVYLDILIDLKAQIIAVEKNAKLPFSFLEDTFFNRIKQELANNNIELKFISMAETSDFWNFIKENQDTISELEVEVFAPNMPASSRPANKLLKEIRADFGADSAKLTAKKDHGALKLSRDNKDVQGIADLSREGVGSVEMKTQADEDHQVKIYNSRSGDVQKSIESDKKKLDSSVDTHDHTYLKYLKEIFNKIKKLVERRTS